MHLLIFSAIHIHANYGIQPGVGHLYSLKQFGGQTSAC